MSDAANPLAWVAKAEEDYMTAQLVLKRRKPMTSISCFHSQQCAEKYLKAILVLKGKEFPKMHDLDQLKVLCEEAGVLIPLSSDPLELLTMYAVEKRYPGNEPTKQDAQQAIATAKLVRRFVRQLLGMR